MLNPNATLETFAEQDRYIKKLRTINEMIEHQNAELRATNATLMHQNADLTRENEKLTTTHANCCVKVRTGYLKTLLETSNLAIAFLEEDITALKRRLEDERDKREDLIARLKSELSASSADDPRLRTCAPSHLRTNNASIPPAKTTEEEPMNSKPSLKDSAGYPAPDPTPDPLATTDNLNETENYAADAELPNCGAGVPPAQSEETHLCGLAEPPRETFLDRAKEAAGELLEKADHAIDTAQHALGLEGDAPTPANAGEALVKGLDMISEKFKTKPIAELLTEIIDAVTKAQEASGRALPVTVELGADGARYGYKLNFTL